MGPANTCRVFFVSVQLTPPLKPFGKLFGGEVAERRMVRYDRLLGDHAMGSSPDAIDLSQLRLGQGYSRADVATIGGVRLPRRGRDSLWLEGIVEFSNAFLFSVTL